MMNNSVLSPQCFERLLWVACSKREKHVAVKDLWVVPDYKKYFSNHINKKLKRYAKGQWTQLQIIFEAVDEIRVDDQEPRYPLGVKVSYRAFSAENAKILKRLPKPIQTAKPTDSVKRGSSCLEDIEQELLDSVKEGDFFGIIWDSSENNVNSNSDSDREMDSGDEEDRVESEAISSVGYVPVDMNEC